MATIFASVKPGDVISSELMNFILSKLGEVDQRVLTLETGGSQTGNVVITGFDPPTQVLAGQVLTIQGNNFAFPPENNVVTIDGAPITAFRPDSTGSLLKFVVPTSLNIPAGGKNVTIMVKNNLGEHLALYRVLPSVQAPGNPPSIGSVAPASGPFIFVNQAIIITGQNFAANPLDNIIRFRVTLSAGGQNVYPQTGQALVINEENSDTTQIEVTVPNIVEVPAGQSRPVTLEVGVGAHVPAAFNINVRRPAS
jgi:IPT/TIG domain